MQKPRPPAAWQAVGVVLALVACQGTVTAKVVTTPAPVLSWAPVVMQDAPVVAPTPEVIPAPTLRPTTAPGASYAGGTIAAAKAYALAVLGPTQYACLAAIVRHEDGTWNPLRTNPVSGAYGIPQAAPGSKMASAGSDWRTNPVTQVRWLLGYLRARYGSACGGWAFWLAHRWY